MRFKNRFLSILKSTCRGFSLVEVMIAITIIGVIGVISVAIFTQTLRTSSETEGLSNLKQNGEQAIAVLTEAIRNAEAVVCYGPPDNTYISPDDMRKERIVIRSAEGKYVKLLFVDPVLVSGVVTENGYIAKQDNLDPELLSAFCDADHTSSEIALTNNDLSTGVSISGGEFKKIPETLNKDTISITFKVNPSRDGGENEESETVNMQTTIQVR